MFRHHRTLKTISYSLVAVTLIVLANSGIAQAGPQPLPPLPSSAAISAVASRGASFVPMGVPANILNSFGAFDAAGLAIENNLDTSQAVSYIGTPGNLLQTAIPMKGAASTPVKPNMKMPDGKPGYIVGGLYQPVNGANVLIATFDNQGVNIDQVRRYTVSNGKLAYSQYNFKRNQVSGPGGHPAPLDTGSVLVSNEACFTLTTVQLCFTPDSGTRDSSVISAIQQTYTHLNNEYNLGVGFDLNNAVPDLIGTNYRARCGSAGLSGGNCLPNLIMTSAAGGNNNTPIAIFRVTGSNDIQIYDVNGIAIGGGLPVGDYVVMNAQPGKGTNTPGASGALFLVNGTIGKPNYMISAQAAVGYGGAVITGGGNLSQAAVKDGMSAGWGW